MAAENGQTRSSMGSSMSNSADIFNLMDNLLPRADCVEMVSLTSCNAFMLESVCHR
jgi:hypothetical protein